MCNMVFVSTDSPEDLAAIVSPNFEFSLLSEVEDLKLTCVLEHPNRWFVTGRYGGCSCHLRHLIDDPRVDFGFHEPFDWCPEDPEDVEDTAAIYDVFRRLVTNGANVDVVDLWNSEVAEPVETVTVSLAEIDRGKFLFMENRRLVLTV